MVKGEYRKGSLSKIMTPSKKFQGQEEGRLCQWCAYQPQNDLFDSWKRNRTHQAILTDGEDGSKVDGEVSQFRNGIREIQKISKSKSRRKICWNKWEKRSGVEQEETFPPLPVTLAQPLDLTREDIPHPQLRWHILMRPCRTWFQESRFRTGCHPSSFQVHLPKKL